MPSPSYSLPSDGDQLLADVAPGEEPDERRRRLLQPVSDVLDVVNLSLLEVPGHLLLELVVLAVVVEDHEALHAHALADDFEQVVHALWLLQVVLRDHSTGRDPPMGAHVGQHGLQCAAAHVLEVDVNALWEVPEQC